MKSNDPNARLYQIARSWGDENYDENAGLINFFHPANAHMEGHTAHLLRESGYYAYALLLSGHGEEVVRAVRILELILMKQNDDQKSKFWACFTCEWEQDWETWELPDQNWAQFMGMVFGYILALDAEKNLLPASLAERITASFRLTVQATIRRDVGAAYSNIALLSSAVALSGAALLCEPGADEFARRKLQAVMDRSRAGGTFDEYLSPTYYATDLYSLYSVRKFASDPATQAIIGDLLELAWADINRSYHPPTLQFGGPHARAYGDNLLEYAGKLKYYLHLATGGGFPLNDREVNHAHDCASLGIVSTHRVPLMPDLGRNAPGFRRTPVSAGEPDSENVTISQFRNDSLIFGTIDKQNEWEQRRNLLAYWVTGDEPAVGICKGFAFLGHGTFKDAAFFSIQSGCVALVAVRVPRPKQKDNPAGYRLQFNLTPLDSHTPRNGGWRVSFAGATVNLLPFQGSGGGDAILPEITQSGRFTAIDWNLGRTADQNPALIAFAISIRAPQEEEVVLANPICRRAGGSVLFEIDAGKEKLALKIPE